MCIRDSNFTVTESFVAFKSLTRPYHTQYQYQYRTLQQFPHVRGDYLTIDAKRNARFSILHCRILKNRWINQNTTLLISCLI